MTDVGEQDGRRGRGPDPDQRIADLAHDLNNSLAAIVAVSQLIRTDPDLPPGLRDQAERLVEEAQRTRSIVERALDIARQPASALPANPAAGVPAATDRPVRILVVDDERAIRDFLARVLRRSGYEPVLAATGEEALAAIDADRPSAILSDHRMAGMSGAEFHEAVAARDPDLAGRVAFMSGDVTNPDLRQVAERAGAVLLAKPFDVATVGTIVAELLARPQVRG